MTDPLTPDLRYISAQGGLRRAIAGLVMRWASPLKAWSYYDYAQLEEEVDLIIEGQFPPYRRGRHEVRR